ncbi:MAG TPA: superoxide dismutase family protein [Geobacteraceae bacterium]|nr:superoxide dismutase family protein [Geobacteraceae bacterium]
MGHAKILLLCSALFLVAATGATAGNKMKARADIKDATGKTMGTATLTEEKKGVKIVLKVSGLSPGKHGFHLHEKGACDPPDFKSAGGHFNPFGKHHGAKNPEGKHAGDFPNLEVKENGTAEVTVVAEGATLKKGVGSLLREGGTAIVIHADPDDEMSDPAGNSGTRIGCGTIVTAK